MPTYTYKCTKCDTVFELFFYINDYIPSPKCINCKSKKTERDYVSDIGCINSSIIKSDNELKTLGDLANRNRDRMSNDQKIELEHKHNSYKEQIPDKPLPQGMSRINKPNKIKWR